mmetsp:Transcript_24175/g.50257  ORF Transcript_24175/g.50257 Transcript_24175/m.50257 type:complete len:210 (+) Transcript_24175:788-1417(+)
MPRILLLLGFWTTSSVASARTSTSTGAVSQRARHVGRCPSLAADACQGTAQLASIGMVRGIAGLSRRQLAGRWRLTVCPASLTEAIATTTAPVSITPSIGAHTTRSTGGDNGVTAKRCLVHRRSCLGASTKQLWTRGPGEPSRLAAMTPTIRSLQRRAVAGAMQTARWATKLLVPGAGPSVEVNVRPTAVSCADATQGSSQVPSRRWWS